MIGTIVNTGAVLAGSLAGLAAGRRLPERIKDILMQALGLCVLYIGVKMSLEAKNALPTIACVLLGAITGEVLGVEKGLERLAGWLKSSLKFQSPTFVQGFVTASVMYLTGPMTILGCIKDGVAQDASILYIKSLFDMIGALALSSAMGVGVMFSAASVLFVQGALTLGAHHLGFLQRPEVLEAVTSTGGVLIVGIGLNILDLKKIRVGNFLPALVYAIIGALYF